MQAGACIYTTCQMQCKTAYFFCDDHASAVAQLAPPAAAHMHRTAAVTATAATLHAALVRTLPHALATHQVAQIGDVCSCSRFEGGEMSAGAQSLHFWRCVEALSCTAAGQCSDQQQKGVPASTGLACAERCLKHNCGWVHGLQRQAGIRVMYCSADSAWDACCSCHTRHVLHVQRAKTQELLYTYALKDENSIHCV
jgi:hypothetical protein